MQPPSLVAFLYSIPLALMQLPGHGCPLYIHRDTPLSLFSIFNDDLRTSQSTMAVTAPEVIILDDDDSDDVQIVSVAVCKAASTSHGLNNGLNHELNHEPSREPSRELSPPSPPSPTNQAHKPSWADGKNIPGL